jgi:hypothetical protein
MRTSSATHLFLGSCNVESERTARLAQTNYWNELVALRDRQREQRKSAIQVVRLSELPLESNAPTSLMRPWNSFATQSVDDRQEISSSPR